MDTLNAEKNLIRRGHFLLLVSIFTLSFSVNLHAEDFKILKTDPQGQMAVIRNPDGRVKVVKRGDKINFHDSEFRIVDISDDRVVLQSLDNAEKLFMQVVRGKQSIKRIRKDIKRLPVHGVR